MCGKCEELYAQSCSHEFGLAEVVQTYVQEPDADMPPLCFGGQGCENAMCLHTRTCSGATGAVPASAACLYGLGYLALMLGKPSEAPWRDKISAGKALVLTAGSA